MQIFQLVLIVLFVFFVFFATSDSFTDSGISKFNGQMGEKELTPWESEGGEDLVLEGDASVSIRFLPCLLDRETCMSATISPSNFSQVCFPTCYIWVRKTGLFCN